MLPDEIPVVDFASLCIVVLVHWKAAFDGASVFLVTASAFLATQSLVLLPRNAGGGVLARFADAGGEAQERTAADQCLYGSPLRNILLLKY